MFFGDYLIEKKALNMGQVKKVLAVQSTMKARKRKLFGDITVQLGYVKKEKMNEFFLEYCKGK